IASTQEAVDERKNSLTTGTLTASDIKNSADYEAGSLGLGFGYTSENFSLAKADGSPAKAGVSGVGTSQQGEVSTGGQVPGSELPSYNGWSATAPVALGASGSDDSVTKSGISGGAVEIRDSEKQQGTGKDAGQVLAGLDRSVSSDQDSSNALKPIFNEREIQAGFEIVGALQREVGTFLNNRAKEVDKKNAQAKEADAKAADMGNGLTDEERLALRDQAAALRAEAQGIDADWGAGGTYRQAAMALMAGAGGNVMGSTAQFAQNALINYVQQQGAGYIGKLVAEGSLIEGSPAHAALHAIVGCAGSAASGQGCGSGALGAAASSLLTGLFSETRPDETAAEREAKRNLIISLVGGMAALGGIDAATATTSATAAVDNNWLATQQVVQYKKEMAEAETLLEKLAVEAKWLGVSRVQDGLTGTGFLAGLVAGLGGDVIGVAQFLASPVESLNALKSIIAEEEVRAQLGESLSRELEAKIDNMSWALEHGGAENAFMLGLEAGEIVWHVGSAVLVVKGAITASAKLADAGIKVGAKGLDAIAAKAEVAAAEGTAAIRANVLNNIAESQAARTSSNFGTFVSNEGKVQEAANVWPPNRGRFGPVETTELQPGSLVDRYGSTRGTFVAPEGTPFANRALPSYYESSVPYFQYEVVELIPDVLQSRVLPWFGQRGMGTQFELPKPVQWYLDNGSLKVK
ncbi:MAG: glycohydrolase toxin TNT-related protein, partial [Proteobacteria bacterium]|nr:glycohydrolase toxin TNT-related protein [Pseudomonadota bacterium]